MLEELSGHQPDLPDQAGPSHPPLLCRVSSFSDRRPPIPEHVRVFYPSPSSLRSLQINVKVIYAHVKNSTQEPTPEVYVVGSGGALPSPGPVPGVSGSEPCLVRKSVWNFFVHVRICVNVIPIK